MDETAAGAFSRRLAGEPPDSILAFADQLAAVLHALDSPERPDQLVIDPTVGDDPFSMSDDTLLYARCAVVAAGRSDWEQVLAEPAAMAGRWQVFDSEWLHGCARRLRAGLRESARSRRPALVRDGFNPRDLERHGYEFRHRQPADGGGF